MMLESDIRRLIAENRQARTDLRNKLSRLTNALAAGSKNEFDRAVQDILGQGTGGSVPGVEATEQA